MVVGDPHRRHQGLAALQAQGGLETLSVIELDIALLPVQRHRLGYGKHLLRLRLLISVQAQIHRRGRQGDVGVRLDVQVQRPERDLPRALVQRHVPAALHLELIDPGQTAVQHLKGAGAGNAAVGQSHGEGDRLVHGQHPALRREGVLLPEDLRLELPPVGEDGGEGGGGILGPLFGKHGDRQSHSLRRRVKIRDRHRIIG